MKQVVEALYDGKVLIPQEPLELQPGQRVLLQVSEKPSLSADAKSDRHALLAALWYHFSKYPPKGGQIPDEALRREGTYSEMYCRGGYSE